MRFLLGLTVVLALLYGGYWVVGRTAKDAALDTAILQLREAGWQVETDGISTRGFPSRFDTTFAAPRLVAPSGRVAWEAPWAQLLAVSYLPNRAILALADEQTLTLDGQPLRIATRDMRASVRVAPAPSLPLETVTVEAGPTALTGAVGEARLGRLLAALREGAEPGSYDLFLEATQIELPFEAGALGRSLPQLRLDGTLTLDTVLDRHAVAPSPVALSLRELRATWGPSTAVLSADLAWTDGAAAGPVRLEVTGWEALLDGLAQAGLIDPVAAGRLAPMIRLAGGGADDVSLEFEARDGALYYGPFPVWSFAPVD